VGEQFEGGRVMIRVRVPGHPAGEHLADQWAQRGSRCSA
jgi:hypothetical protein